MSSSKGANTSKKRPNIDLEFVRELAGLLEETGLTEIEIEEAGTRVRVARQGAPAAAVPIATPATAASTAAGSLEPQMEVSGTIITSPLVGTAYLSPAPGAPPFVNPGGQVEEGQTILIVEAMKTMNQVPSTASGRIAEIYVQDGQPVEFGEPLMRID